MRRGATYEYVMESLPVRQMAYATWGEPDGILVVNMAIHIMEGRTA